MKTFLILEYNFTEMCSLGSNWQYGSVDSDNGLAPNRRQAIIWSNVGKRDWHIDASPGLNELRTNLKQTSEIKNKIQMF